jgi:hypothetical protein
VGLIAALALALGLALAASGWVRPGGAHTAPPALTCVLVLAAIVVLTVDVSAVGGFHPAVPVAAMAAVAIAGWTRRRPVTDGPFGAGWASTVALPVTAIVLALPVALLPVPFDTDAQGFGYLALAIRQGGTLDSLAPWHPEIRYLYAPGALGLFATLSAILPVLSLADVMLGAGHVTALLFVWLAWEFGEELGRSGTGSPAACSASSGAWGPAMAVAAGTSFGLWTTLLDAHYTALLGLVFALATLTVLWRFLRTRARLHAVQASVALGGVLVTHADTAVILALALLALVALGWWATDYPLNAWRFGGTVAIGAIGLALVTPWLLRIWPLMMSGVRSPFPISATHLRQMVLTHGLLWPFLALVGAAYALPARALWTLTMVGWLVGILELSTLGVLERLLPGVAAVVSRFNYPFSLAWHGPIIPYMVLGASLVVRVADHFDGRRLSLWARRGCVAVAIAACLAALLAGPLLAQSRHVLGIHGAFASANDVAAMRWLRAHTDPAARILNYPGDYDERRDWEGHWAPVIAERDVVYFRWQPFFTVDGASGLDVHSTVQVEQRTLLEFWRDPADPGHAERFRKARISYVLVPDVVGDPDGWQRAWRWRPPALLPAARSRVSQARYLRRAFRAGGAEVYRLCRDQPAAGPAGSECP